MPQQWFNPDVFPPSTIIPAVSTAPTSVEIRPMLMATPPAQLGGARQRGGFSPSIMGGFAANAQGAIVPAALYLVYHTMVPKKGDMVKALGGVFTRKSKKAKKNRR